MVVFAFQYVAVKALGFIGAWLRWVLAGSTKPLRYFQRDVYFSAALVAFGGLLFILLA